MLQAYKHMFENYANFSGRTSLKQFWLAFLMHFLISFTASIMIYVFTILSLIGLGMSGGAGPVWIITVILLGAMIVYSMITILPFISMQVRRMHDQNMPGWIVALCYVGSLFCGMGSIALLVFMCLPGTEGANQYGEDPNTTEQIY